MQQICICPALQLRRQISFWKHKTTSCSEARRAEERRTFQTTWCMKQKCSVSSANLHCLLTLDLSVYLGFLEFPLHILRSLVSQRGGLTVWKMDFSETPLEFDQTTTVFVCDSISSWATNTIVFPGENISRSKQHRSSEPDLFFFTVELWQLHTQTVRFCHRLWNSWHVWAVAAIQIRRELWLVSLWFLFSSMILMLLAEATLRKLKKDSVDFTEKLLDRLYNHCSTVAW